jgi:predicted dehydrogenase
MTVAVPVAIGLIGPGAFGRQRLKAAQDSAWLRVVAVYPAVAPEHDGCVQHTSLSGFLAHPGLEAVIVSAPNPDHLSLGLAAIKAGKHVLIEKPLTNGMRDGALLVREAAARGLALAVGHNSRRAAHVRALRGLVGDGRLGRVVMAEAHFSHDAGLRLTPDHWRWHEAACPGGPFNLLGVHEVDTLQYVLGPVHRVASVQRRLVISAEISDTTMTILEFHSGALAYVGANYVSPSARALRLFGTGGNARWEQGGELTLDATGGGSHVIRLSPVDTLREEMEDFAASIREHRPPEVDGVAGLLNVAVLEAAVESNRRGAPVEVQEIVDRAGVRDLVAQSPGPSAARRSSNQGSRDRPSLDGG